MARDKIEELLSSWIQTQEDRINKMVTFYGKIELEGSKFYAEIFVTKTVLVIDPDDEEKEMYTFNERRLRGAHEIGAKGIKIRRRFKKTRFRIFLKSKKLRNALLKKIRTLMGDESTDSESQSSSNNTEVSEPAEVPEATGQD